jgi:hypothetical protein
LNAEVQRRAFLASVAAASMGAAGPEPLARLLDGLGRATPHHVGMAEVAAVEAAADAYMGFDLARSPDLAATMASSALRWSTELLDREMATSTRTGLRCRIRLAVLDLRDGNLLDGEAEGYRIIADAAEVTSTRISGDLQMLHAQAAEHGARGLVADLAPLLG